MTELNFKGKEFVYNHHLSVPIRPLEMQVDKGIGDPSLDGNLIIQGDNLHALKALLPMYAGKVDCIFIDPPYNTGNEDWSYNDNVNAPMIKEWLESNPISIDDGLRHDKWCAMMWPRLKLLRELLAESGIIAATIDHNELDNFLLLLDEIFGANNRLAVGVWQSDPSGGKQKSALRVGHEFIVFYGGGSEKLTRETKSSASLELEDSLGKYAKGRELNKWGAGSHRSDRETMFFPLYSPDGSEVFPIRNDGEEGRWRKGAENQLMRQVIENPLEAHWELRPYDEGVVVNGKTERWVPYEKIRSEEKAFGWSTLLTKFATTADGTKTISDIFGSATFDTPKPIKLLDFVVNLIDDDAALFLDSFAGSGTTAHAVLEANKRDGGNRRFILVEMEDYADRLTAERVRRVINGYDFQGTQKTELLREKLSWSKIDKGDKLRDQVAAIENLHGHEFDKIAKAIKDDHLLVTGEKKVEEHAEGLSGKFTYCTLGDPIELDAILTGESLPDWQGLGRILFHMATSQPLDAGAMDEGKFYLGSHTNTHVWLIYKPDLEWLKSPEAALNLSFARSLAEGALDDRHIVFAPARHVSQKMLADQGLPVEFAPLPFALYRLERE